MRIYTYATHDQGLFKELINNRFSTEIRVVGFGTKWNGFMDKIAGVRDAIISDGVKSGEIVVFLDGFDSRIRLDPALGLQRYKQLYPKQPVLCSLDTLIPFAFVREKIFRGSLNSGMYMGPAGKVCSVLEACMKTNATDDQRAFNLVHKSGSLDIVVDRDQVIFHNLTYYERGPKCISDQSLAVFVSCPGELSVSRYSRVFAEYVSYIWVEILLICVIIFIIWRVICVHAQNNKTKKNIYF